MEKRPYWQTFIIASLWLGSLVFFCFAFYQQHQSIQADQKNLLASLKPVSKPVHKEEFQSSYHAGLFGIAVKQIAEGNIEPEVKQSITFGPRSLQGVFIQDDQAYALVTDESNKPQIILPESITAHSLNSVTIQTQQGIKSLHLKHNRSGLSIRRVASTAQDRSKKEKQTSKADEIRLRLLRGQ